MAIIKRAVAPSAAKTEDVKPVKAKTATAKKEEKMVKAVKETKAAKTVKTVKAEKTVKAVKEVKPVQVADEKKVETKKAEPKKAAAKKTVVKKTAVKKTAIKKETVKKAAKTEKPAEVELYVQYGGHADVAKADIDRAFEAVWTKDMGKSLSEVKEVTYYFKTEESAVYFVVNGDISGRFDI